MPNSNVTKGKVWERNARNKLTELTGEEFKRLSGTEVSRVFLSGDVTAVNSNSFYRNFHWEIKAHQNLKISDWIEKAKDDSGLKIAVVMAWDFRKKRWIMSLEAENLISLLRELAGYRKQNNEK